MRWTPRAAFRRLRHRSPIEDEIEEELCLHIQSRADDLERSGLSRSAAERRARVEFGGREKFKEECREARGFATLESALQDTRRALRRLIATPIFSLTAIGALAFGIAAAAAMLSVTDAFLLRPLPGVAQGERLVHLERVESGVLLGNFSYPDYLDYQAMSPGFAGLAATAEPMGAFDIATPSGALQVNIEMVSANYFSTLGVRAERGRVLLPGDEQPQRNRVAVLSDEYWRTEFGANPDVVGHTLRIDTTALTIAGVAAPDFHGASLARSTDVWVPITTQPFLHPMDMDCLNGRNCGWITIFGRLAPDVGIASARSGVDTAAERIGAAHPLNRGRKAEVVAGLGSWSDDRGSLEQLLTLLLTGTLLLVAMTSTSLGSLFLARMGARQHEVATQLALGASRRRVTQQFLIEGALIAATGVGLGTMWATRLATWLLWLAPTVPHNLAIEIDDRVLGFAATAAILSTLGMSLAPAWIAARSGLHPALQQSSRGATGARRTVQFWMLTLQVSMSFLLLIAAGLAARSLRVATAGQVPASAGEIVITAIDTQQRGYQLDQAETFFNQLLQRLQAQPSIATATLAACIPPQLCIRESVFVAGSEPPPNILAAQEFAQPVRPDINTVAPGFLRMFDTPLVAGRDFDGSDRAGSALVCIVDQSLAERLWPHASPLGHQIAWPAFNTEGDHDFTVVGVAADRHSRSLVEAVPQALYVPAAQVPSMRFEIAVRGSLSPTVTTAALRRTTAALDPALALENVHTLAAQVRRSVWQPLAIASLAGLFGLFTALMAATGLYGTLTQVIRERRRELGVRMALGASRGALVWMIMRDGLAPAETGLLLGALVAGGTTRLMAPWLFGVSPVDAMAWLGAVALLTGVTLAASLGAARQTVGLHPIDALRCP